MSRSTLRGALVAGLLAATAVADQRVGLALAVTLLAVVGVAVRGAPRRSDRLLTAVAAGLAVQPALRDAGWVVGVAVVAALVTTAAAAAPPGRWRDCGGVLLAPLRCIAATRVAGQAARALRLDTGATPRAALGRGLVMALFVTGVFGALLVSADRAFADLAGGLVDVDVEPVDVLWRVVLGTACAVTAVALARTADGRRAGPEREPAAPGRVELRIVVGALVMLFAVFVAVQLRVLFGGAAYVRESTGLGYGEYARQGFLLLLVVAALTMGVIAVAARRSDPMVRALSGVLCLLTLVVLMSAQSRLGLVEDAYGFTRVRYAGHAVVLWLAVLFVLVLVAGTSRSVARQGPRVAATVTAGAALAFCLSNPDGRIAERAVDRAAAGGPVDLGYLGGLSADALPALERFPGRDGDRLVAWLRTRLERPDGLAGWNLARRRAR